VGPTTLDRVLAFATTHGIPAEAAFRRAAEIEGVRPETAAVVPRLLDRLVALGHRHAKDLVGLTGRLVEEVAYRSEVERCYPDESTRSQRWAGVEEVLNFAENYARRQKAPTLSGFLDELTLCADDRDEKDSARDKNAVTLMTLHASKGLEFQRVYLVGLEEGLLPHGKSLVTGNVEEERRLTYVGITRARSALTLTYTADRARYGKRVSIHPSRFLFEIKGSPPPASWRAADASEPEPKKRKKKGRPRRARTGR
jgi:DNA helicase-2/ATP-dependent DNA helicase PcrA